jgi:hypothetical protein
VTLYDFEDSPAHTDPATNAYNGVPFTVDYAGQGLVLPVGVPGLASFVGEHPESGEYAIALVQSDPGGFAQLTLALEIDETAYVNFDYSGDGYADDVFNLYLDGDLDSSTALATNQTWGTTAIMVPAGTHSVTWEVQRGAVPDGSDHLLALIVDNVTFDPVNHADPDGGGDGGGGGPTTPTYKRNEWVRHLGGLYVCRVDGASTEPGPGDSADWYEVVARPVAVTPYTPDPRDLPVRAAIENPFDPGEAGLWLQLDADGNVIGQVYEDGEA